MGCDGRGRRRGLREGNSLRRRVGNALDRDGLRWEMGEVLILICDGGWLRRMVLWFCEKTFLVGEGIRRLGWGWRGVEEGT